jgi:hypothetical protein
MNGWMASQLLFHMVVSVLVRGEERVLKSG